MLAGSAGRRASSIPPSARQDAALKLLTTELAKKKSVGEIAGALRALSNLGDARSLKKIQPYLAHEDYHVRDAAYSALRHMMEPEAKALIYEGLRTEKQPAVQMAILKTFKIRPLSAEDSQAFKTFLQRHDLDDRVRLAAAALIPEAPQEEL
ncbi:MAG: HEAT repeat domain-containing protein [Polyangiaceae bacterium]|nr:HEAT repeat domain-containing protein [Polyangiaceae bacterium]